MKNWSRPSALATSAILLAAACGEPDPVPPSQLLLVVETDAPVPRAGLAVDDLVLFDRLRISVHRGGDELPCAGCARDFVLSSEVDRAELSVGVAQTNGDAVAHVELYADRNLDRFGNPDVGSSLSAWVKLPRTGEEEVRPLHVTLSTEALGRPRGARTEPVDAASAGPATPLARWPEARVAPCAVTPGPEEACVPGGVVWMGNALRRPGPAGGLAPRLVRMSPFLVDQHEVTVADLRASGLAVTAPSADADPGTFPEFRTCTYSATAGPRDALPVTCVSHELAVAYCKAHGKVLPTEAQHEYLHGGLRGTLYPWGDDDPSCGEAVFGRDKSALGPCGDRAESSNVTGSGRRDALVIGGRSVVDLAGNVSEWARERYRPEDDDCNRGGYFVDPACEGPASGAFVSRGGSFLDIPLGLRSEVRFPTPVPTDAIGFRCARPAQ